MMYMKGKYQFTESADLEHFKVIDHAISMDFHPRHGTVIPITQKNCNAFSRRMVNRKVSDLKEKGSLGTSSSTKFNEFSKRVVFISR